MDRDRLFPGLAEKFSVIRPTDSVIFRFASERQGYDSTAGDPPHLIERLALPAIQMFERLQRHEQIEFLVGERPGRLRGAMDDHGIEPPVDVHGDGPQDDGHAGRTRAQFQDPADGFHRPHVFDDLRCEPPPVLEIMPSPWPVKECFPVDAFGHGILSHTFRLARHTAQAGWLNLSMALISFIQSSVTSANDFGMYEFRPRRTMFG